MVLGDLVTASPTLEKVAGGGGYTALCVRSSQLGPCIHVVLNCAHHVVLDCLFTEILPYRLSSVGLRPNHLPLRHIFTSNLPSFQLANS